METYQLFLDDFRMPQSAFRYTGYSEYLDGDWYIVRDYEAFKEVITMMFNEFKKLPSLISFDHDLAADHYEKYNSTSIINYEDDSIQEKTGYHCAKWLIEFCIDNNLSLPNYLCHSMNPVGKKNILSLLSNFKN